MFERCRRKGYVESRFWDVEGSNGGMKSRWILKGEGYGEIRVVNGKQKSWII